MNPLGMLLIIGLLGSVLYLFSTAMVYVIFTLISIGGYDIDFNVWIGGLILLILILLFKKK